MKTLNEWLATGLLDGLEEEDYPRIVKLFNQVFIYSETITSILSTKHDHTHEFIFPLIRRIYSQLKYETNNKNIDFEDIVDYINVHEILVELVNKMHMIQLFKLAYSNIDAEAEFLRLLSQSITLDYVKSYEHIREVKTEKGETIDQYTNYPFRLWTKINKKQKKENETESTIEEPLPDEGLDED
jgi:hypothetical protein